MKLTILLPVYNNQDTILNTLESIKWADEIIVVDSFSLDETISLVNKYPNVIVKQHEYINSAKQKNWALQFCSGDWIFQIDSDEWLDSDAESVIREAIKNAGPNIDCYQLPRKNHVLGKWIKHGGLYPDWENRLFRNGRGEWFDREVHSNIQVKGDILTLNLSLMHNGMPNISKQLRNLDRYTTYETDELVKKGCKPNRIKQFLYPILVFIYRYFYLLGFLDGWIGFLLAINSAYYYFITQTKLRERFLLK